MSIATLLAAATLAAMPSDKTAIAAAYLTMDQAYGRSDAVVYAKNFAPRVTTVQETGARAVLDRPQVVEAVQRLLRDIPGRRVVHRETTRLSELRLDGPDIIASGTRLQEATVIDPSGTQGHTSDEAQFEERWVRADGAWRISEAHDLKSVRHEGGRPSPSLMLKLNQMRTTNAQLRNFNASNNLSKCMSSNALSGLSLDEQRTRCQP